MTNRPTLHPKHFILTYLLPLIIITIIAGYTLFLRNNPEREIQKRITYMAETISKPAPQGIVAIARTAQTLIDFFTTEAQINPGQPLPLTQSRREFINNFIALQSKTKNLNIHLQNPQITLGEDPTTARVNLTASITGTLHTEPFKEHREFQLHLKKEDGKWRISQARPIQAITPPSL